MSSQKVRSGRAAGAGELPAMIAELIAPIETPDTQSGSMFGLVQRLVDAGLVGAERAAALQHQRDPLAAVRPPGPRMSMIVEFVGGAHPWRKLQPAGT